jgi:hypothetical protein
MADHAAFLAWQEIRVRSSRAAHSRRRVGKGMTRLLCTGNQGSGCPILRPFGVEWATMSPPQPFVH